jgi:hypothetical protein
MKNQYVFYKSSIFITIPTNEFKMNLLLKYLFLLLLFFLLSVLYFDPGNKILGIKSYLFVAVSLLLLLQLTLKQLRFSKYEVFVFGFFIIFAVTGVLLAYLNINNMRYDYNFTISTMLSFFLMFLIFMTNTYEKEFKMFLVFFSVALSVITILLWLALLYSGEYSSLQSIVEYLNYETKSAMLTYRNLGPYRIPMIYYKSVVLLFIGCAIVYEQKKELGPKKTFILFALMFTALFLSGTKTNQILSVFLICTLIFSTLKLKSRIIYTCFLSYAIILCLPFVFNEISGSSENYIKQINFIAYIDLLASNVNYLFVGDGFGSYFYSPAHNLLVTNTELVYLDLLRWFGGIFLVLIIFLIFPLFLLIRRNEFVLFASYLSYLVVMGTNPLFISSTGMLAMVYYYSEFSKKLREK